MGRIEDKRNEVIEFVEDLMGIVPDSYNEYKSNLEKRLACERAFERIIEATHDLAILFIKEKRLVLPSDDEKAFGVLAGAGIINENLASRLSDAKGMRNILAHQYDKLDDEIIFEAIHKEIVKDVNEFLKVLI